MPAPTHECPCGCGAQIAHRKLACRTGWFMLPINLRYPLNANKMGTSAHRAALREALNWYREFRTHRTAHRAGHGT